MLILLLARDQNLITLVLSPNVLIKLDDDNLRSNLQKGQFAKTEVE